MLKYKQKFSSRLEIGNLLGGDIVKGIVTTNKINAILLFTNEEELYSDYFYPKGSYAVSYTHLDVYKRQVLILG